MKLESDLMDVFERQFPFIQACFSSVLVISTRSFSPIVSSESPTIRKAPLAFSTKLSSQTLWTCIGKVKEDFVRSNSMKLSLMDRGDFSLKTYVIIVCNINPNVCSKNNNNFV